MMANSLNLEMYNDVLPFPDDIFQRLENEVQYLSFGNCKGHMQGKAYPISTEIAAFGDDDLYYTFSRLTLPAKPWTPLLLELKSAIEFLTGMEYNFVLVNRYKDGNTNIRQHKDKEPNLDENYPIDSLSLGETRTLVFKKPKFQDRKVELKSNSLLVMKDPTNKEWSHGIPREKMRTGIRINLTFRKMKTSTSDHDGKRKRSLTLDPADIPMELTAGPSYKRVKKNEYHRPDFFTVDSIPEDIFSVGDDISPMVNAFRTQPKIPIVCDICGKSFTVKQNLERHVMIHSRIKPFTCEICEKKFGRKYTLNRHKTIHEKDNKSFNCIECNKTFSRKDNMQRHLFAQHDLEEKERKLSQESLKKTTKETQPLVKEGPLRTINYYNCIILDKVYSSD